jgi:hypothetical protein
LRAFPHSRWRYRMRRLAARLVWSWGLTLSLTTGVRAQIAAPPAEPWSLSLGVGETYDTNLTFSSETGSGTRGEFGSHLSAGGSRTWTGPRGSVSLNGNAADFFYRHTSALDAFTFGFGAGGAYAVTRRLTWSVNDTLSSAYAQDTTLLTNAGLLFPRVIVHTNSASNAFSYDLSPKSQIVWGLSTQAVGFAASKFAGAKNIGSNLNFVRRLGSSESIGIGYDFQISNSSGAAGTVQAVQGTWRRSVGQRATLAVSGGIRPYTLPGVSGYLISPRSAAFRHLLSATPKTSKPHSAASEPIRPGDYSRPTL